MLDVLFAKQSFLLNFLCSFDLLSETSLHKDYRFFQVIPIKIIASRSSLLLRFEEYKVLSLYELCYLLLRLDSQSPNYKVSSL